MLVCLASFSQSKSLLELFGSSVGIMAIIFGFYRENKKVDSKPIIPGMYGNFSYREVQKVNVTPNYFLAMSCVIIFQWLLLIYILSTSKSREDAYAIVFTFIITILFYPNS